MMPIFILLININLRQNGIPTDSHYKIQFLKLYLVKNTVCMYYKRGPSKRKQQNMKNEIFNLNWMNLSKTKLVSLVLGTSRTTEF